MACFFRPSGTLELPFPLHFHRSLFSSPNLFPFGGLLLHFWRLNAGFPKNPLDGNTRATHVCLLKDGVKISLLFTLSRSFKSNLYYIAKLLCITLRFTARWSYIAFYTLPLFYLLHMVSRALTLEEKRKKRRCVQRVTPSSGKLGSKSNLSLFHLPFFSQR